MKTYDCMIIGAGFAGIGAAIRLTRAGVEEIVVLERADRVGGTWRDNTYPGAACDIPSLLYSYSWLQKPDWTRAYSSSAEILGYIDSVVDEYRLERFLQFNVDVTGLSFDATRGVWTAATAGGEHYEARTVVAAAGPLSNASLPAIRGIDTYAGHKIHSARWDHDYDMTGKRVAVIGTGASAVQIIPELVKQAAAVKVFQRTPGWVLPRPDYRTPAAARALFKAVPATQHAARTGLLWGHELMATGLVWNSPVTRVVERVALAHLHRQVRDPWMRRQLTPDFRAGCKRMLMSSDYYPALQQPNCRLISWPIATISPVGIRTSDGIEHHVDCIVFATGYDICKAGTPFPITGADGQSLAAEWAHGAQAFKSVSVHGYPNLFFTFGPNSGPGHNSALVYLQGQLDYAVQGIRTVLDNDLRMLDVRADVQRRHNQRIQKRLTRTTWNSGCSSWYLTEDGYNATMYPGFATQYLRELARLKISDYEAIALPVAARQQVA